MIIRINLHPNKKQKTQAQAGSVFFAAALIAAALIVAGFFYSAQSLESSTKQYRAQAASLTAQIEESRARVADIANIRQKIGELHQRELVLARLASIRQGPQYVLNEIGRLLSNPRDIISRQDATKSGWQLIWEPDNVMIHSFKDLGEGQIQLEGQARTMDDIQEFWTRLKTSSMLTNISLVEIKDGRDSATGENTQSFTFTAKANFNYQTANGKELVDKLTADSEAQQADTSANAAPKE